MVGSGTQTWVADLAGWLVPALPDPAVVKQVVRSCAILSLISATGEAGYAWRHRRAGSLACASIGIAAKVRFAALIFGAAAFTVLLVILGIRIVYVAVNLVTVFPVQGTWYYGFDADGLWSLAFLFAACAVAAVSTRDKQLYTCQFLIAVVIVTWSCLLRPVYRMTSPGGLQGSGATLTLTASLALLLVFSAFINWWADRSEKGVRLLFITPETNRAATLSRKSSLTPFSVYWPGFGVGFTGVALAVMLLACYQLAVPVGTERSAFRVCALVGLGSASVAAGACYSLLSRRWSPNLADTAVGLSSLAVCCLAVSVVPTFPRPLAERYPVVFNAMIVGLALATASCTWLATFRPRETQWLYRLGMLMEGLRPHARRGAFLSTTLAVTLGGLMALWPRLSSIAVPDDSIGRVTAGFGGNLLLLLVVLWSARRFDSPSCHILTLLTIASAAGFMMMRMLPYTPHFG